MNTTKLIAAIIVITLIGVPTVSFARARGGGYGGGYSGGSRGYSAPESMGSRGSRTYDQNGAKPIERSVTPNPSGAAPQSAAGSAAPNAQPAPAMQPSFMQRNPLLAGLAAGIAGSYIGNMLFGATESSARTTDAGEPVGEGSKAAGGSNSTGLLLILMLLGAGAFYYFLRVRRSPTPDFSGITRNSALSDTLPAGPSGTALRTATVDPEVTSADKTAFQQLLIDIQTAWSKQDLADLRLMCHAGNAGVFQRRLGRTDQPRDRESCRRCGAPPCRRQGDLDRRRDALRDDRAVLECPWLTTVSLTKRRGESGYLVEGNEETPSECGTCGHSCDTRMGNGCSPRFSNRRGWGLIADLLCSAQRAAIRRMGRERPADRCGRGFHPSARKRSIARERSPIP